MTDWRQLMERHGPTVWQTVSRLVADDADAADCFQETFLAAVELSRRQRVLSWSATLRALAANKAADCLRRRYRQRARHDDAAPDGMPDGRSPQPPVGAFHAELGDALRYALSTLDARQAQAFCLIALEAMTYDEAAEAMGVSRNHVGVLLNRARAALKHQLRPYAPRGAGDARGGKSHVR